jgi:hypothetical protein
MGQDSGAKACTGASGSRLEPPTDDTDPAAHDSRQPPESESQTPEFVLGKKTTPNRESNRRPSEDGKGQPSRQTPDVSLRGGVASTLVAKLVFSPMLARCVAQIQSLGFQNPRATTLNLFPSADAEAFRHFQNVVERLLLSGPNRCALRNDLELLQSTSGAGPGKGWPACSAAPVRCDQLARNRFFAFVVARGIVCLVSRARRRNDAY